MKISLIMKKYFHFAIFLSGLSTEFSKEKKFCFCTLALKWARNFYDREKKTIKI